MTDPTPTQPSPGPAPQPQPEPQPQATPPPTFEQRMDSFGREMGAAGERIGRDMGAAGERIGRQAEAAGQRFARDPGVQRAADTLARMWGIVILAVGLWFLADVTLGLDMPSVPWEDLWPLAIIFVGLAVVVRGLSRRQA